MILFIIILIAYIASITLIINNTSVADVMCGFMCIITTSLVVLYKVGIIS